MSENGAPDFYEVLQISPNADPEMIHRVYRLLAQRFHPDNQSTGDADKFRCSARPITCSAIPSAALARCEAARSSGGAIPPDLRSDSAVNDVESEQLLRLTVFELLYARLAAASAASPTNGNILPTGSRSEMGNAARMATRHVSLTPAIRIAGATSLMTALQ
jgi:hypothetical protein